jgi:hypothetical protein
VTLVVDASVIVAALVDSGSDGDWAAEVLTGQVLAAPYPRALDRSSQARPNNGRWPIRSPGRSRSSSTAWFRSRPVEPATFVVVADDPEHLRIDEVRGHLVVIGGESLAERLGPRRAGDDLEEHARVDDEHQARPTQLVVHASSDITDGVPTRSRYVPRVGVR